MTVANQTFDENTRGVYLITVTPLLRLVRWI